MSGVCARYTRTQQSKPLDSVGKSDGAAMVCVCVCMYMHTQEFKRLYLHLHLHLHLHVHLHGIFLEMAIISVVNPETFHGSGQQPN